MYQGIEKKDVKVYKMIKVPSRLMLERWKVEIIV